MNEIVERALEFLRHRADDYRTVFLGHGAATDRVLADLAKFCRAHESTFHVEHTVSDRLDGRREVWLRIERYLELNEEQLWQLYGNKSIESEPKE